jgi:hypothetical protein
VRKMKRFIIHVMIKLIKWNEFTLSRIRIRLLYELDVMRKARVGKNGHPPKT